MSEKKIRVRFAPSPTGPLHVGGVRTALYNYLFAKKHGGDFILRIEDTDQNRYIEGAENYIIEALNWAGIKPDEGVGFSGEFEPYRQSERKSIYRKYAEKLVSTGSAYYAFDTPAEIEAMREQLKQDKSSNQQYNAQTRNTMKNSLTLSDGEVFSLIESGAPFVVRYKMPENEEVVTNDIVRGEVKINTKDLDDKVLFKSDGMPTYHLANVVDDYLMKITHVIRGEEWLPSLPLHVLLYRNLGWENDMPEFAHLPLLLKPNGKGKLSKRDGDQMGFPVFPLEWKDPKTGEISSGYRESGYFPGAFVNMLALLGWNPGTEQEMFSLEELVNAFDIEKVGKSGSKFDPEKAKWFNHQYLINKPVNELSGLFKAELAKKGIEAAEETINRICELVKDRANFVSDFWQHSSYFFEAPKDYDAKVVKKRWKEHTPILLKELKEILTEVESFTSENTENTMKNWIEQKETGMGQVMNPFRLVLTGGAFGVHLFDIIEILGKEETLKRIDNGLKNIGS